MPVFEINEATMESVNAKLLAAQTEVKVLESHVQFLERQLQAARTVVRAFGRSKEDDEESS